MIAKDEGERPFVDKMLSIYGMTDLTPREQITLSIIATYEKPGARWPSLANIARVMKKARSTTSDVVQSLERKGRIRKTRGQTTTRYTVAYDEPLTVRGNQPVRNISDCQEDPNTHCQEDPNTILKTPKAATMKENKPDCCINRGTLL